MIIFMHEERAYLSWVTRHRQGFVVDWLRQTTRKRPTLHRANCPEIRQRVGKNTHWTTGRHVKTCSLDLNELKDWVNEQFRVAPVLCTKCRPVATSRPTDLSAPPAEHDHLTRLGAEILNCLLEVAIVYLDEGTDDYSLTVEDIAGFLGKTPAQITAALLRLAADQYISVEGSLASDVGLRPDRRVYPTAKALRTLPAFETMKPRDLAEELHRLQT